MIFSRRHGVKMSLSLLLLALMLSACAVGNKYDFSQSAPTISKSSDATIAVGVLDQRPYILDGDKEPKFIGLQRGGFGNPFDVTTASKQPLSNDIEAAVLQAFRTVGIKATGAGLSHDQYLAGAKGTLLKVEGDRYLLIVVNEWKADTYSNTKLLYTLSASVFEGNGVLLAENKISGTDNLGGSAWNPPAHASKVVPIAMRDKLDELLNTEEILDALMK